MKKHIVLYLGIPMITGMLKGAEKIKLKTFEKMPQNTNLFELIPNYSVGQFIVGTEISKYLLNDISQKTSHQESSFEYDSYKFEDLLVWVEDGKITTICCKLKCYWLGYNLIKMDFESFKGLFNVEPTSFESIYMLVDGKRQNQTVYDFDELGLQIWVWRKKIVTVLVSNFQEA